MLSLTVVRSYPDGSAICYCTSGFVDDVIFPYDGGNRGPNQRRHVRFVEFARWRNRGEACHLWLHLVLSTGLWTASQRGRAKFDIRQSDCKWPLGPYALINRFIQRLRQSTVYTFPHASTKRQCSFINHDLRNYRQLLYDVSPRESEGVCFYRRWVECLSLCVFVSVATVTKKLVDGFVPNFMGRFLGEREDQVRASLRPVDGCGSNGQILQMAHYIS